MIVEFAWDVVIAALLGLAVGAVATWAYFTSQREREEESSQSVADISSDESAMIAAFQEPAMVLDRQHSVLKASTQAVHYGLVRNRQVAHRAILDMVEALHATGLAQSADLELPRGRSEDSTPIYLDVTVSPLPRDRVIVLGRDQTAARRLDQTRRDFVANVSHELKTPVGAIGLLAETVSEYSDEPEVVGRFAEQMKVEASRLALLVQEIIDLSRLQEPDALVESDIVDVDEVVTEAIDRVSIEAESRTIEIKRGAPSGLKVAGNQNLLTTAVRNILENAIHYSPDHSRVSIGVRASDGYVRIAVVDQGIGISPDAQARVFERFYRVDAARSRSTGGTGLGLSIVKHIAADHGGEVTLWSKPGRGSTFTLAIPQYTEPTEADAAAPAGSAAAEGDAP